MAEVKLFSILGTLKFGKQKFDETAIAIHLHSSNSSNFKLAAIVCSQLLH